MPPGQRITLLLDERSCVCAEMREAMATGAKIPPQSDARFKELTREIDRVFSGYAG